MQRIVEYTSPALDQRHTCIVVCAEINSRRYERTDVPLTQCEVLRSTAVRTSMRTTFTPLTTPATGSNL